MGARELLTEEDTGVGGGARGPFARRDARVERSDLVGVSEAGRGCASRFWHLFGFESERWILWEPSDVRKLLVIHAWRVANAPYVIPRSKTK